jgi:hypothetical protein
MNRLLLVLTTLTAFALATAPLAAEPARMSKAPKPQRSCFYARSVTNFAAADDRNLYIRVGTRDVYHLSMFGNCFDLSWVHALGLTSRGGNFVCEGTNVSLDVVTRDAGPGVQSCPVSAIRKLTPEEVAGLPKGARP